MPSICQTRRKILKESFGIDTSEGRYIVALAGNPNVGKSTVFNALTGLRQHTGNWPGKTVNNAQGSFSHRNKHYLLVDLPGTYSLMANSVEEEIARDFICFGQPDATVVVVDATSLERNLNLTLQIMEIYTKVVVCVNLIDEAQKKNICLDLEALGKKLGVPVVGTAARTGKGLKNLREAIFNITTEDCPTRPMQVVYSREVEEIVEKLTPKIRELIGDAFNARWIALRLLDGDKAFINRISRHLGPDAGLIPFRGAAE